MNKFKEIFLDLEQKILSNEYPPHSLLPSENQLIKMYSVSRETVRKALNLLKNAGYIQKKQGKGSIVLDLNRFDFPISGLTSFKELQDTLRIPSETKVVEIRKIAVSPKYMVILIGQLLLKLGNWYVKERLMVKLSF